MTYEAALRWFRFSLDTANDPGQDVRPALYAAAWRWQAVAIALASK